MICKSFFLLCDAKLLKVSELSDGGFLAGKKEKLVAVGWEAII